MRSAAGAGGGALGAPGARYADGTSSAPLWTSFAIKG
jgi:hypothetical protein